MRCMQAVCVNKSGPVFTGWVMAMGVVVSESEPAITRWAITLCVDLSELDQ